MNGNFHGIFGYSDDNLLLAPSIYALQQMLRICENFAEEHNMKFSTDDDPSKCKKKCTAFTRKYMNLPTLTLCGTTLPWVDRFKHLGHTISNKGCFTDEDVLIKRAQYINKNRKIASKLR